MCVCVCIFYVIPYMKLNLQFPNNMHAAIQKEFLTSFSTSILCIRSNASKMKAVFSPVLRRVSLWITQIQILSQDCGTLSVHVRTVPIRCFVFTTSIPHAKHNNKFRELSVKDSSYKKVNDLAFNMYKSKFTEPEMTEGFSQVVKITVNPSFDSDKLATSYRQFLDLLCSYKIFTVELLPLANLIM